MKHFQNPIAVFFCCIVLFCFSSCSTNTSENGTLTSLISVNLKSSGTSFEKVYLEIVDVQLRTKEDSTLDNAWVSLNTIDQGTFDICDIDEQFNLALVQNQNFTSSYIYEIRLRLGANSFIDNNEVLIHLDTEYLGSPIAANSLSTDLIPNWVYDITIDFDVDNSIQFFEDENAMVLNPQIYTEIRHTLY